MLVFHSQKYSFNIWRWTWTGLIVGKTLRRRRHVSAIVRTFCAIFLPVDTQLLYFLFCCGNWRIRPCLLMVFHAISCWGKFQIFASLLLHRVSVCYFLRFFQLWYDCWVKWTDWDGLASKDEKREQCLFVQFKNGKCSTQH